MALSLAFTLYARYNAMLVETVRRKQVCPFIPIVANHAVCNSSAISLFMMIR
jgi:hypothetical protein